MESNTSTSLVTIADVEMADKANIKGPPALFKTYFDDPKMSDIAIFLNDRTVSLHKIVLCRGSEYFANLLSELSHVRICSLVSIGPY